MSHLHISPLFQSATITAIPNNNLSSIESLKDVLQNILLLSHRYLLEACHLGFADRHSEFWSAPAQSLGWCVPNPTYLFIYVENTVKYWSLKMDRNVT